MTATDWLGLLAGTLTTIAFVPQAVKIWVTKSADDVSYLMFGIFSVGIVLWLAYGIALGAMPIIVANVVTLVLSVLVIALKVRYSGRRGKREQEADLPCQQGREEALTAEDAVSDSPTESASR